MKHTTLNDLFEEYLNHFPNKELMQEDQRKQLKMAFYAGAIAVTSKLANMEFEEGGSLMISWANEAATYVNQIT